jgi:diazepam-binding inhibitor (GABA receptor modulator, acyl-CoA-binding protein)
MDLKQQFEQAATESKTLPQKPNSDTLLQLYSLYKQGSIGDINVEAPANPFDFVAKAKFDSWAALRGKNSEEAMKEYIALVNRLKNE